MKFKTQSGYTGVIKENVLVLSKDSQAKFATENLERIAQQEKDYGNSARNL